MRAYSAPLAAGRCALALALTAAAAPARQADTPSSSGSAETGPRSADEVLGQSDWQGLDQEVEGLAADLRQEAGVSISGFTIVQAGSPNDLEGEPREEIPFVYEVGDVPDTLTADETWPALERGVRWLLETQREDGSWASSVIESAWEAGFAPETYYAWKMSSSALVVRALLGVEETPARRASLERALRWLCTSRLPRRGSDWDVDGVWAYLYGLVATTAAANDPRFADEPWRELIDARGRAFMDLLERHQIPDGGWAYYDDPTFTRRPKWGTSFCTALVLPAVADALALGWCTDRRVLERAQSYVRACTLPNGAYAYDRTPIPRLTGGESINSVKGSLGRIQVCNWGLARTGDERITDERVREGLDAFFEHHRFLDVARMRPIPHEAFYANAGYFYLFAHYYAAEAIELLPLAEREAYHARLRPHLVKVQRASGMSTDFLGVGSTNVAGTALTVMALQAGLAPRAGAGAESPPPSPAPATGNPASQESAGSANRSPGPGDNE